MNKALLNVNLFLAMVAISLFSLNQGTDFSYKLRKEREASAKSQTALELAGTMPKSQSKAVSQEKASLLLQQEYSRGFQAGYLEGLKDPVRDRN